jgi:hypothetical protein
MIVLMALATVATVAGPGHGTPSCVIGDYMSVCNFVPARSGAYRIASDAQAVAKGVGPHGLSTEYEINGAKCKGEGRWNGRAGTASAPCVVRLEARRFYHIVAVAQAKGADRRGVVGLAIEASSQAPTLAVDPW